MSKTTKMSKEEFMAKFTQDQKAKDTKILGANGEVIKEVKVEEKKLDLKDCHKLQVKTSKDQKKTEGTEEPKKPSQIAKVKTMKAKKKESYRDEVYKFLEPFINEHEGVEVQKVKEGLAYKNKDGKWVVIRVIEKKAKPDGAKDE